MFSSMSIPPIRYVLPQACMHYRKLGKITSLDIVHALWSVAIMHTLFSAQDVYTDTYDADSVAIRAHNTD